jgi:chromosome condensin MukBEF ATPase and DNA-binding subunit MukB
MNPIEEKIATHDANIKSIFHQIDDVKSEIKAIHKLATSIELLAQKMNSVDEKVDNIDDRLDAIEKKDSEDIRYYKRTTISCIITGVITAILGAVFALIIK